MVSFFLSESFLYLLLATTLAFFTTHGTIPAVIRVAREKHLLEEPNGRSSHAQKTPCLGGIAIFASLAIVFLLVAHLYPAAAGKSHLILPSLIILFFIGLKDDILVIDPYKKLVAQLIAAGLLIACADIRIGSLFGLFGVYELPYLISFALTVFIFVVVINAYNLIDGIDGLAGSLGVVAALAFGVYFYVIGVGWATVLCATLIGSLLSFLCFNFSERNKVFMGDSGSLIVGFVLAILAITFIQVNEVANPYPIANAPTVAVILLAIPLFDALRVFSQRILAGHAPFRADRNHVHHFLVDSGLRHGQATLLLSVLSGAGIVIGFLLATEASVGFSFAQLTGAFLIYSLLLRRNTAVRRSTLFVRKRMVQVQPQRTLPRATAPPINVKLPVEVEVN